MPFSARILKGNLLFPRPRTAFAVGKPPYAAMRRTVQLLNDFDDAVMVERLEIAVPPASPPSESSSSSTKKKSSSVGGSDVDGVGLHEEGEDMFTLGSFEPTALANTETVSVDISFLPTSTSSENVAVRRELRAFTNLSSIPFVLPVYSCVSPVS